MAVGTRAAKDALFEALASVAAALASGRRAEIVELLAQGERSVDEVAQAIDQSLANASHHLRTLARAGLVSTRREGTRVIYRLAGPEVAALWAAVREVAATQVADVAELAADYLGPRDGIEPISRAELARRLRDDAVVVLDVRPDAEYRAGHIPTAVSVPLEELERRLDELPADAEIVAYCRGPYCVFADEAVRLLTARGHRARPMEGGLPEWRQDGYPVADERRS